ncbi:MAG: D-alanyl-D-alanine carboxypeptidase family protein [Nannocystaceae bacterium]
MSRTRTLAARLGLTRGRTGFVVAAGVTLLGGAAVVVASMFNDEDEPEAEPASEPEPAGEPEPEPGETPEPEDGEDSDTDGPDDVPTGDGPWWQGLLTKSIGRRVRVKDYAALPADDPRLATFTFQSAPKQLHGQVIEPLTQLLKAAKAAGFVLGVSSGHRVRRWATYDDYAKEMIAKYGSLAEGKKWVAWDSPHFTGLAVDLAGAGIWPTSKDILKDGKVVHEGAAKQKETPAYKWLLANAYKYGANFYAPEPWHLEFILPKSLF